MCDYSLGGLPNRLAVEGEDLMVYRFPTHSIGLASPADIQPKTVDTPKCNQTFWDSIRNFFAPAFNRVNPPAVCIPPGASLVLKNIPLDLQRKWNLAENETVTFVQTSAEVNSYRDAVRFRNGRETLLQNLYEGMRVTVVSLGGDSMYEEEPELMTSRGHRLR